MTQMTKIELKKIIQIPIKINRHNEPQDVNIVVPTTPWGGLPHGR